MCVNRHRFNPSLSRKLPFINWHEFGRRTATWLRVVVLRVYSSSSCNSEAYELELHTVVADVCGSGSSISRFARGRCGLESFPSLA